MTNSLFTKYFIQEDKMKRLGRISVAVLVVLMMALNAVAAGNLVTNGDASAGVEGWGYWCQENSGFTVTKNGSYDSSDCYYLYAKNEKSGEHAAAWKEYQLDAGKTYTVTACVKHKGLRNGAVVIEGGATNLSMEHGAGAGSSITDGFKDGALTGDSDWKVIWYTFTATESNFKIELRIWEGYGDLWFDNFTLTEGDKPAYSKLPGDDNDDTPATNLITNGDASSGADGWGYWCQDNSSFSVAEKTGPDNSDCYYLYAKNEKNGEHAAAWKEYQLEVGKVYTVTACVKHKGLRNGAVVIEGGATNLSMEHGAGAGSSITDGFKDGALTGDSDWKVIWYTFTATESNFKIELRIWEGYGDLWFDNFTLTEGSKPAYKEVPRAGGDSTPGGDDKPNPGTGDLALAIVPAAVISLSGAVIIGKRKRG